MMQVVQSILMKLLAFLKKQKKQKSPLLLHFHQVALNRKKRRWLACYGSCLKFSTKYKFP